MFGDDGTLPAGHAIVSSLLPPRRDAESLSAYICFEKMLRSCSKMKESVAYITDIPEQFDEMPGFAVILWILPVDIQSYKVT